MNGKKQCILKRKGKKNESPPHFEHAQSNTDLDIHFLLLGLCSKHISTDSNINSMEDTEHGEL